jgi:hypothetical protein
MSTAIFILDRRYLPMCYLKISNERISHIGGWCGVQALPDPFLYGGAIVHRQNIHQSPQCRDVHDRPSLTYALIKNFVFFVE